jgi:hypothetical protein
MGVVQNGDGGTKFMALYASLLTVTLTLLPLNSVFADEKITRAMNVHGLLQPAAREISINDFTTPTDWLEFAAVDFCYRGIVVDTETGEATELYAPCSVDAIEGNLDLA